MFSNTKCSGCAAGVLDFATGVECHPQPDIMFSGLFKLPVVSVLFNVCRPVASTVTAKSPLPSVMKSSGSHSAREEHLTTGLWRSTSALRSIGDAQTVGSIHSARSVRRMPTCSGLGYLLGKQINRVGLKNWKV